MIWAQKPPMHFSVVSQQSESFAHFSSVCAHPVPPLHMPLLQKPPQQSTPLVHVCPLGLHGASTANARMLPLASSCPGR